MNKKKCNIIRQIASNLPEAIDTRHGSTINHYRRMKRAYIRSGGKVNAILGYANKAAHALATQINLNDLMVKAAPLVK